MTVERWNVGCQRCGSEASAAQVDRVILTACLSCEAMTVRVDGVYVESADELLRFLGPEECERVGRLLRGEDDDGPS